MRCEVCGMDCGISHNCAGPMSPEVRQILESGLQPPADAGIGYYLGEVGKILRWDDEAIRRNAKDPKATLYGLIFWFAAILIILLAPQVTGGANLPDTKQLPLPYGLLSGMAFGVGGMIAMTLLQAGLCYLIAKWFFEGKGTFVEVMRPLMLVWFVNCLGLIPGRGIFYGAIAWTMVLTMVFEEVTGIRKLQAFCICAGINFCVFAVQFERLPVTHHL